MGCFILGDGSVLMEGDALSWGKSLYEWEGCFVLGEGSILEEGVLLIHISPFFKNRSMAEDILVPLLLLVTGVHLPDITEPLQALEGS